MAPIIFRALVYKRYRIFNRAPDLRQTWNNGKEVPRWGVAEIQKMIPSTTGRVAQIKKVVVLMAYFLLSDH